MKPLKEEFLQIISNYQGILHKVNFIYFKNSTDREDNFQKILYQLWKSYSDLRNKDSIGSWIYAVSINTSISRLKKKTRIEYREELPESMDTHDIEGEISRDNNFRLLLKAISSLNEIDKSIILLYLEANKTRLLRIDIPVYIFHGIYDGSVPVEGVYDIQSRFRQANKTNLNCFFFEGHNHDLNYLDWPFEHKISKGLNSIFNTSEFLLK